MGNTYEIMPTDGNFRTTWEFTALRLNSSHGFTCEEDSLESFLMAVALHNGVWRLKDGRFGICVTVMCQEKPNVLLDRLFVVDDLFLPRQARFLPMVFSKTRKLADGVPLPRIARSYLSAASFVHAYGTKVFSEKRGEWEAQAYRPEEIVRALRVRLMDYETPWKGYLHVRSLSIVDEATSGLSDEIFLGEMWKFMDDSAVYITPTGMKTEDEFRTYVVHDLKTPQYDTDFQEHMLVSTTIN